MNDKTSIGVRIHDIHHGLIQSRGAIIETEFDLLKTLGASIQLATTIKDHEVINDLKPFYAAAGELKIERAMAKEALAHLEELDFVRLQYQSGKREIKRIDVLVPDTQKIYTDFGDYFNSENKSELSAKTIEILDKLSAFPHKERDIRSNLNIENGHYDLIKDVCTSASLLDSYSSPTDSESVLYSPLYWDDNPQKIFDLLEKHKSNDFLQAIGKIKGYQGLPDGKFNDNSVLTDAVALGCLPTLSVNSTSGLKKFLFTPRQGVGKLEKNLLHKARVLISCVRYGENFAGITKIIWPEKILNALLNRGYLKGHTESLEQYEPARNLGLVKLIPSGNRYEVHFIDNDENKLVVKMALDMLSIGDTSKFDDSEEQAKKILVPGNILHPTQSRTHILKEDTGQKSKTTVQRINNLLLGIE
ncbi:hypothetical protein [Carboxylicivirga marina]|uniref:Uncharacterized protein n=1 Tax=Carboxylicivirga marina TaxID=2800988 RepID=A0ABS1HQF2_9BACT|nr:hypothetical protein [Carboxylicivirga marina]MBK3519720.1 hypothetical protein [Carboxylicivirga marina]